MFYGQGKWSVSENRERNQKLEGLRMGDCSERGNPSRFPIFQEAGKCCLRISYRERKKDGEKKIKETALYTGKRRRYRTGRKGRHVGMDHTGRICARDSGMSGCLSVLQGRPPDGESDSTVPYFSGVWRLYQSEK